MTEILTEFATWQGLATMAGCTTAVIILTQITKGIKFIDKLPTQIWSYLLALFILYPANYFTGTLNASTAALILFNAAIVSLAANGGYEALSQFNGGK